MALPSVLKARGLFSRLTNPRRIPGVLTTTEFEVAFARERARVERYSNRFALLVLGPVVGEEAALESLARIVVARIRIPDLVGQLDHERLAVILPETDSKGAWRFADDLFPRMAEAGLSSNCVVYVYPHEHLLPSSLEHVAQVPSRNGRNGKDGDGHDDSDGSGNGHVGEEEARPAREGYEVAISERSPRSLSGVRHADSEGPVVDLSECFDEPLPLWKRCMDIVVSAMLLVLFSPLFLVVALAVKLTSPGPVLFRQKRAGLGGVPFTFYKFRSMYEDAEERRAALEKQNEKDGPIFKIREDPRMTPLGRVLRKTSVDELPQLWNVFTGDMTLVGPRPPTLNEVPSYEPWQRRRLNYKGGLTCIWQVSGRSEVGFLDWMRMDIRYVQNPGFLQDLKLLSRTLMAVISGRGAC